MPKAKVANPLYAGPQYNDPTLGVAAQNIAAMILGGESPNDAAERESTAALRAAETRKAGFEGDLLQYPVRDLADPVATARNNVAAMMGLDEPTRAQAQTLYDARINQKDPANISKARNLNFDVSSLLLDPSQAATVAERNAAVEGKPLVSKSEGEIYSQFDQNKPVTLTPVGRQKIATDQAQARNYDASAKKAGTGQKAPKDMYDTGEVNEAGLPVYKDIPNSAKDVKQKAADKKNADKLKTINSALDDQIRNIDQLIGSEDGKIPQAKGLEAMTGSLDPMFPTIFTDTANAESDHDALTSKAAVSGLRDIRGTAGAPGSITEKEWPIFQQQVAALSKYQGTPKYINELKYLRSRLQAMKSGENQLVQDASENAAPTLTPEEQQELQTLRARFKK